MLAEPISATSSSNVSVLAWSKPSGNSRIRTPAASKSAEEKAAEEKYDLGVRRARAVQIYLKSQEAVYALLDAEAKYSTAISKNRMKKMSMFIP